MSHTIAFDVYGTLIDPIGIAHSLQRLCGEKAVAVAHSWRQKQLEYSFRQGLMRQYRGFDDCTLRALDYAFKLHQLTLNEAESEQLMQDYRELPAFGDVKSALEALGRSGHHCHAFSNGHPDSLEALLKHADIRSLLSEVVSVHDVESYKPDPLVYEHFCRATGTDSQNVWLVSSNPFDILGAAAVGWKTAWVQRDPLTVFDPWDVQPTTVIESLGALEIA